MARKSDQGAPIAQYGPVSVVIIPDMAGGAFQGSFLVTATLAGIDSAATTLTFTLNLESAPSPGPGSGSVIYQPDDYFVFNDTYSVDANHQCTTFRIAPQSGRPLPGPVQALVTVRANGRQATHRVVLNPSSPMRGIRPCTEDIISEALSTLVAQYGPVSQSVPNFTQASSPVRHYVTTREQAATTVTVTSPDDIIEELPKSFPVNAGVETNSFDMRVRAGVAPGTYWIYSNDGVNPKSGSKITIEES